MSLETLRIVFAGTPEFSATSLAQLLAHKANVVGVFTQPDRPAGRGQKLHASPVKQLAEQSHIPIFQPENFKSSEARDALKNCRADVMVVVAYGLLLPKSILELPRLGCVNVHASLLPQYRGAAPIQQVILSGDLQTGVTLMQMDEGLDTGDMLLSARCDITTEETGGSLHDKLAQIGSELLISGLSQLAKGQLTPRPQDNNSASYASKITKTDCRIDWQQPAKIIDRKIRAFNPWPIAYTVLNNERVRAWQAEVLEDSTKETPGTICQVDKQGIVVATGDGLLRLTQIQKAGGKVLSVAEVLNANRKDLAVGYCFDG